jgi:hypothetical protein
LAASGDTLIRAKAGGLQVGAGLRLHF